MDNINLGQIFTRRVLADYMVSLFTLPSKSLVLDPCFGSGVFLDSILANTDYNSSGYEIDSKLFNSYANKNNHAALYKLYNADFLLSNNNALFDGIIMNPPYIRHEKINELEKYGITKSKLCEESIFAKLPKTANLYMYFVVKAINVLKACGELIVIFPESWLNAKGGMVFRTILESHCSVERRVHVTGRAFEKEVLVNVVILKIIKNVALYNYKPQYVKIDTDKNHKIEQTKEYNKDYNKEYAAKQLPLNNRVSFGTYANIRRGLTTGCNEIFINPKVCIENHNLVKIISSPKSVNGYSTDNAVTDNLLVIKNDSNVSISNELNTYLKNWEKRILELNNPKTLANKVKMSKEWYLIKNISCEGIIFGYMIRNDIRFILNSAGITARDNFYVISPNIDSFTMLALLNNYYIYAQLETNGRRYGGGMLKLQKYDIEALVLTNLSIVSKNDKLKLAMLGCKLSETGDKKIIDDITDLLSFYETIDFNEIKSQYDYMRIKRLGSQSNGKSSDKSNNKSTSKSTYISKDKSKNESESVI